MLSRFQQGYLRHQQAALAGFSILWQKPLPTVMTLAVIAIALTLPTFFWILGNNVKSLMSYWNKSAHIVLYLKQPQTLDAMNETVLTIQQLPGIQQAQLKTPAQGIQELSQQEGMQDIMNYLPENPLPAMIEVTPDQINPLQLSQLVATLKTISAVDQVRWDIEWAQRLNAWWVLVKNLIRCVMLVLSSSVVLIIGNTLRLAFHHRQEEITVLKLIGATDGYIMRPFLYLGIWYGVLGALGAIVVVTLFLYQMGDAAQTFLSLYQISYPFIGLTLQQSYVLILLSGLLGFLAAQCFIRIRLPAIEVG